MKTSPESILAAAYDCFARDGHKRVALEQIAAEAGISRAPVPALREQGGDLRAAAEVAESAAVIPGG